jgi:hypothetical protein
MDIEKFRLVIEINNALAEWDPIGSQTIDDRLSHSEYIEYVKPILEKCFQGHSIRNIFELKLHSQFTTEQSAAIDIAAKTIEAILSNVSSQVMYEIINN